MLDLKSPATSWPISPERSTLARSSARLFGEPSKASGITGPPSRPSSVTATQRVLEVQSDFMNGRSTPGSRKISSLIFCSVSR
ncbi:hypothetical protein Y695_04542 [Hydrogenophaga sp. T4]|nr:hypothetical protein Y695_04542 [Hydrogenophaga sp. T4]